MLFGKKSLMEKAIKNMRPVDLACVKISAMLFGIFIVALFPDIVKDIHPNWFLALAIVLAVKPLSVMYKK